MRKLDIEGILLLAYVAFAAFIGGLAIYYGHA